MEEIEKLHFNIGEVAAMIGEAPSLIRYWEKEFPMLLPEKSAHGIRKFTRSDVQLIKLIHHLVRSKGMTLEGARLYLKTRKDGEIQAELLEKLRNIKNFLTELKVQL